MFVSAQPDADAADGMARINHPVQGVGDYAVASAPDVAARVAGDDVPDRPSADVHLSVSPAVVRGGGDSDLGAGSRG